MGKRKKKKNYQYQRMIIHCRSNISWCKGSKVGYGDITGSQNKLRHVPCMYNCMYNTRLFCGSLLRHH